MRNKDTIINIKYIQNEDSYERRYYCATIKHGYLDFLTNGRNGKEENKLDDFYQLHDVLVNGKALNDDEELENLKYAMRCSKGNIWIMEVTISKKEYVYKLIGNSGSTKAVTKAFNKFIEAIELSPKSVNWICSIQFKMIEAKLYFLFFEKEPTLFNQRTNEYCYRKGRVDLELIQSFKGELLRGISHLRNTYDYDSLYDAYLMQRRR